jgi:hypothetical protein
MLKFFRKYKIREFSIVWWLMGVMWFGLIYGITVLWLTRVS